MRSASHDPFASTSQALGRARERRKERAGGGSVKQRPSAARRGLEEEEPDEDLQRPSQARKDSSKESGSEPAAIPSRANRSSHKPSQQQPPPPAESSQRSSKHSSSKDKSSKKSHTSSKPLPSSAPKEGNKTLDHLPPGFRERPEQADPVLYYLPRLLSKTNNNNTDNDEEVLLDLPSLLNAAQDDVRLHRGRVQAGLKKDTRLIRTYTLEKDPNYQERQTRLEERLTMVQDMANDSPDILGKLQEDKASVKGKTQAEMAQMHLLHWQQALEVYVHCPPALLSETGGNTINDEVKKELDWSTLFEKLLDGIPEDQDISMILAQASDMCKGLVKQCKTFVKDASQNVSDMEASYRIRLQAHTEFARHSLQVVGQIEDQFKRSGRAALQIGQQLEHAELKRSQCEAASVLIRRWWALETLAEAEENSEDGMEINVMDEVCGNLPQDDCQMDALYTAPENSLEASRTLKQLRAVVRSKGNAAATGTASKAVLHDKAAQRRFDLTSSLIRRTSEALEQRLLGTFELVYQEGGGAYDFSAKPRPGSMDWRELRSLAQALLLFDSGRNLHSRYVDMVVQSRFPELFHHNSQASTPKNRADAEFNMDATRSKLSNLFHRVTDVCTAEFELIAYVFGSTSHAHGEAHGGRSNEASGSEEMALIVARALLQRVISDPHNGLQARINDLLSSIDRVGDFDAGAKKLDTFVVIHEKAAGLFALLKDAADRMIPQDLNESNTSIHSTTYLAARNAVDSLKGFLTSQELALSNTHRQGYINLELRLLHHQCCSSLDIAGCTLVKAPPRRPDKALVEKGILEEYKAPILPLHKPSLAKTGYSGILAGPLKQSVLRQPLIHATDSLARARLMFGTNKHDTTTARVILSIYNQTCNFYGQGFLYPIMEALKEMLPRNPPGQVPPLPFNEEEEAPDLGVNSGFWVSLERVHSASKSFDRELWAENRDGSHRVWEILNVCGDETSLSVAREFRVNFYTELERRGETAILSALDTLSTHIQWVLVSGGESILAAGGTRIFNTLTGQSGGPYAIPAGSSLETPNSPAIKSIVYCLRVQFVHVQAALTSASLASFWTALSMRLYDIVVARLLQHYTVSTVGAVILSRDVEALRSVSMLAGTEHSHWDMLRELVTLYMTPPDAIKTMLVGPDGDASKGLFSKTGRDTALVFLSRRNDYRYKTAAGMKKSSWVTDMLSELSMSDPSDGGNVNVSSFAAGRKHM
mmetsp:Transcript_12395/g.34371  ORF Transcript_12395/g.34371 Transcript_12395/m.34371 type:complete len:1220 (-) Transcript_12395:59-3718(-)